MQNIRLTTPGQDKDENSAVETDPTTLKNWLNDLSSQEITSIVESLDTAISALNEVNVPAVKRHNLLEIYFTSIQKLLQGYDEMRIAQLKMSLKQKHQLCNDIVWLYIKLSHGYKVIVKEILNNPDDSKDPPHLLLTTFRALELTVISLLYAYRYGVKTPALTSLELHQLLSFAEFKNIATKPVKAAKGYAKTPTISSFYSLAMVFVSIDPGQYQSYTLEVLFLALQPLLFNCKFSYSAEPEDGSFIYGININNDSPPVILPNGQSYPAKENVIYLDIGAFIVETTAWLESNKNNKNTILIEDELELFPGVLSQLETLREENVSQAEKSDKDPVVVKSAKLVFGLQSLESILITKSIDMDIKLDYSTSDWNINAEHETYCELTCPLSNISETLSLGDLASIVDCDENGRFKTLKKLTRISRIEQDEDDKILVRLEYVNGIAQPLTYKRLHKESGAVSTTQYNGIYLTPENSNDDYHVLIANRSHFNKSRQFLLNTYSSNLKVEAIEAIKETPYYVFIKIRILEEDNNHNIVKIAS